MHLTIQGTLKKGLRLCKLSQNDQRFITRSAQPKFPYILSAW